LAEKLERETSLEDLHIGGRIIFLYFREIRYEELDSELVE
jgi:hypothetical protein